MLADCCGSVQRLIMMDRRNFRHKADRRAPLDSPAVSTMCMRNWPWCLSVGPSIYMSVVSLHACLASAL
jgi:hypothetical protein